ncbi:sensor histidine kinase [Congregibacter sp.]|uniref:sensor histidine kinase n=1 Tax=Congregibacter sp. TaxID=2744308 RepID=UPI003F6B29EB
MSKNPSIERQVTRSFVGLTLGLTVVYLGLLLLFAYITEDEIIDRLLGAEVTYLQERYAKSQQWPTPRLDYMVLYRSLEEAPTPVREQLRDNPQSQEIFTPDDSHYHVRFVFLSEELEALLVAEVSPLLAVSNFSRGLFTFLGALTIITLALSLWLAYRIAKRTTRPIMRLSEEVALMHSDQSDQTRSVAGQRLSAAGQNDEIGYLADTIQNSFQQLSDALDRETHFTRDVSHELRTPLTVIKNMLTVMEDRQPSAEDARQLRHAVEHMQSTVSVLLALAREESLTLQSLRLRPLVEEVILSQHRALENATFSIDLSIADDYELQGNPQLLTLLIGNLIENALRYASEPRMSIAVSHSKLVFSNPICIEAVDDPMLPRNRQTDSPGLGQGLFLVKRIAARLNWKVTTDTDAEAFTVSLEISP